MRSRVSTYKLFGIRSDAKYSQITWIMWTSTDRRKGVFHIILRYIHDLELRARMQLQVNRGEGRHQLARRLFFANQGAFQTGDYEEIMNKATCLSLLSNAVVVWNTVQMAQILAQ